MRKDELRAFLAAKTEDFVSNGREVVRYASPSNPRKISLGSYRKVYNLKEMAWRDELHRMQKEAAQNECSH